MAILLYCIWILVQYYHTTFADLEAIPSFRLGSSDKEASLTKASSVVTAVEGHDTTLFCRVTNLHDKTVSWIRERDLTVLTVDTVTYTGDPRFSVKHEANSEFWWLRLRGATRVDSGAYDCQLNTYPKVSTKVYLKVISEKEAKLEAKTINGDFLFLSGGAWREADGVTNDELTDNAITLQVKNGSSVSVDVDSTLRLLCDAIATRMKVVRRNATNSTARSIDDLISWTLDDVPVKILFPEWKVAVQEWKTSQGRTSELILSSVTAEDAGKIACLAKNAKSVRVAFDVELTKHPKQHYLGLSNSRRSKGSLHFSYPITSAVSGAALEDSKRKLVLFCVLSVLKITRDLQMYIQ